MGGNQGGNNAATVVVAIIGAIATIIAAVIGNNVGVATTQQQVVQVFVADTGTKDYDQTIEILREGIDTGKAALKQDSEEIDKLNQQVRELTDSNESLSKQMEKLEMENSSLRAELASEKEKLKTAEEMYNDEHEQKVRLEQFLTENYSIDEIKKIEEGGVEILREYYPLSELVMLDSSYASLIDGFVDCFGNTHGEAIKFSQSGEIRFTLGKKYDSLVITAFTSTNTRSEGLTRFEFYVDGDKRGTIEKVEKGGRYEPLNVPTAGGDILTIKAIQLPYSADVYLSEANLTVIK